VTQGGKKAADDAAEEVPEERPDVYDIDAPDWEHKCSPLHLSVSLGHAGTVALLLEHGADAKKMCVDEDTKSARSTIAMLAPLAKHDPATAERILLMLLRAGVNCQLVRSCRRVSVSVSASSSSRFAARVNNSVFRLRRRRWFCLLLSILFFLPVRVRASC
jgi:hypothetical protein